ncbi:hypothetical protein D8674_003994 [Pyrus ussuriensis x Pyrus communis]|uniref:Apple domain-containing protein n=1 Tax=Pyrus ussuriensis x Pyrus communis TaxID=2448454 RepID=A0A5N5FIM4_9ROSA|nr:hypothetical protein D8674_003983 [Pyrus ussuriensis x Pyrus communis]KAB2602989.1 hypothetical protein D8674_003994 [Pyrus ussuriensis x Pyrus communis]
MNKAEVMQVLEHRDKQSTQWNSGDFSGECIRGSALCGNNKNDTFLSLKKMKVGNAHSQINVENETECKNRCLNSCKCKAYSYAKSGEYSIFCLEELKNMVYLISSIWFAH